MRIARLLRFGLVLLLLLPLACRIDPGQLLPAEQSYDASLEGFTLVARFVHVTDTHMLDSLSPARFPGAQIITRAAWRPYEAYATQLYDGIIRAVNRMHASSATVDFLLHTGDACDNVQSNELQWLLQIMDGGQVAPLSGPDDRPPAQRPPPNLDPYAPYTAAGLYRTRVHGERPSIPWYTIFGNHDTYAIGTFPIFDTRLGRPLAPLPLAGRPGLELPNWLDPLADFTHGPITPAHPGPPAFISPAAHVAPNPERAYFSKIHLMETLFATAGGPPGHGFASAAGPTWYSTSPAPGLRLIGLDTADRTARFPGHLYYDGAVSRRQLEFLRTELDAAAARGELVIIAAHHPTQTIYPGYGVEVTGVELRELLAQYPNLIAYLAGHAHRNRVIDRGGWLEIETCSTLDLPEEARVIEIWRDPAAGRTALTYHMFSHDDPGADDPLLALRTAARAIALADKQAAARQKQFDPSGDDPCGDVTDRQGQFIWQK